MSSLKDQLKGVEDDLGEFKNVYKMYTDQLIKVKVSVLSYSL